MQLDKRESKTDALHTRYVFKHLLIVSVGQEKGDPNSAAYSGTRDLTAPLGLPRGITCPFPPAIVTPFGPIVT